MKPAPPRDIVEAAQRICGELEDRGVPYAIGGAISLGMWAEARGTKDVDINAFVLESEIPGLCEALRAAGAEVDGDAAVDQSRQQGMFIAWFDGPLRVDVFTPSIDFSWEAMRTRVRRTLAGQDVWVLAAEAIAVFKLLFFRRRDQADLEHLLRTSRSLDRDYVRAHVVDMMGEDDPRIAFWDQVVAETAGQG